MEMAELMEMIRKRMKSEKKSIEAYANAMGITGATLHRYYSGSRNISLDVVQKMAKFYQQRGDSEMVNALGQYALGLDNFPPPPSK